MNQTAATITDREVVGLFSDRDNFESAVGALLDAGFHRPDLSVLSSHQSLDVAGQPGKPWKDVLTAMVGELKHEGPLVASGAIFLIGGPVAATVAGVIATATAGIALKEVVGEVTSTPHTEDFARSLEAGSVILWVHCEDAAQEDTAVRVLESNTATNVHLHQPAGIGEG